MLNVKPDELCANSKNDKSPFPIRVLIFDMSTRTYKPVFVKKITLHDFDPALEHPLQIALSTELAKGASTTLNGLNNGLELQVQKLFDQAGERQLQFIHNLDDSMIRQKVFEFSTKRMLLRNRGDELAFEVPMRAKYKNDPMNPLEIINRQVGTKKMNRTHSSAQMREDENALCTPSSVWLTDIGSSMSGLNIRPTQKLQNASVQTSGPCSHPDLTCVVPQDFKRIKTTQKFAPKNIPNAVEVGNGYKPCEVAEPGDCNRSTLLGYHIPETKMQDIMLASSTTYWQYTLYQGPKGEKVKVHYCRSKETTERIARFFLDEKIVGFDIEWKPGASAKDGIKKNVALIQVASEERIALFHIARYFKGNSIEDLVAPSLRRVLESPNVTKVGVSIKSDCTRLRRYLGIHSQGLFELSHLYKLVKFSTGDVKKINKMLVTLAQQVEEHLLLPLWKGDVRGSDWSEDLDYEQIRCMLTNITSVPLLTYHRRGLRFVCRVPTLSRAGT